jgi:hypothetical protein
MTTVSFASHFARHVACPEMPAAGTTLREILDDYFARWPAVRSYVLDEQGALRQHVVVFVGDTQLRDRQRLSDVVPPTAVVYVMQALSGG